MYQIKSINNPEEEVMKGQFYGHERKLYSKEYAKNLSKLITYTST